MVKIFFILLFSAMASAVAHAQTTVQPFQGGTGIDTSAGNGCPHVINGVWTLGACGGGGGGGGVNPGAPGCPIGFYPTTAATIGPTGLYTDCTTKTGLGLNSINVDFGSFPGSGGNAVPYQSGNQITNMPKLDPFIGSQFMGQVISGTTSYQTDDGSIQTGPNWFSKYTDVRVLSPIQGGGHESINIYPNSTGDNVIRTVTSTYRGVTEGFHEGMELDRIHVAPQNNDPGGHLQLGSIDAFGHQNMTMLNTCTTECFWAGSLFGSENFLVNLTRKADPTGNVIAITPDTDTRFAKLTADAALIASLTTRFGSGTSHRVVLVGGADNQVYNTACPSSVVNNPVIGRNSWNPLNPYAQNPNGGLTQTFPTGIGSPLTQCLTFPTSGLSDGTVIGIWGAHDNKEYAKVVHVVDANHAQVAINHSHAAGEVVSWGPGVGWGLSSAAVWNKPYFSNTISFQYNDMRAVYPIIEWDGTHIVVWVNSSATGSELKLGVYTGIHPHVPATYVATVVAGVVTSISGGFGNDYRADPIGFTTSLGKLPPPAITYGGTGSCTVAPTTHWTSSQGSYTLVLDNGGSGCPSDLTISLQTDYPNPIELLPTTVITNVRNPAASPGNDWFNAYVTTEASPLGSTFWQNNDVIEQTMSTNQYFTGNLEVSEAAPVMRSNRNGPQFTEIYAQVQNGSGDSPGIIKSVTSQCTFIFCFGDAATNYLPSNIPGKEWWARWTPPIIESDGGIYNTRFQLRAPPQGYGLGNRDGGNIFTVDCYLSGQDSGVQALPCGAPLNDYPTYNLIWDVHTGTKIEMKKTGGVNIVGAISENGNSLCKSNGVGCPFIVHGVVVKFEAKEFTYPLNLPYYIGETGYVGSNPNVSYRFPTGCDVDTITASAMIADGGAVPASADHPQAEVENLTQANTLWTANWSGGWGADQNTIQNTSFVYHINQGDQIRARVFAPLWSAGAPGNTSVAFTIYCK